MGLQPESPRTLVLFACLCYFPAAPWSWRHAGRSRGRLPADAHRAGQRSQRQRPTFLRPKRMESRSGKYSSHDTHLPGLTGRLLTTMLAEVKKPAPGTPSLRPAASSGQPHLRKAELGCAAGSRKMAKLHRRQQSSGVSPRRAPCFATPVVPVGRCSGERQAVKGALPMAGAGPDSLQVLCNPNPPALGDSTPSTPARRGAAGHMRRQEEHGPCLAPVPAAGPGSAQGGHRTASGSLADTLEGRNPVRAGEKSASV